ncbi:M16 family metallopeptidase [Rhizobium mayense]|uniref:Insulinase family protein n=1 Tax=Rhizobium mayense TaxID=1312184 RepID=A0ABT7K4K2_9HYPH|nr:insulinase family protein [Rhizobium mayense]MDL2402890.1 insulinase family protein [Rhizobium mayense]
MSFLHSGFSVRTQYLSAMALLATLLIVASPLQAAQPATPWPQASSDLQPDTAVRYGTLTNGMKFAVMHNATPTGQVAIRFRIEAWSRDEDDDQRGLAHFLEHMAFRGSTHVAEDEMIGLLQRKGLTFGPDVNAYTSFDQTIYKLNLPEADTDTVSAGLMLMRETAGELRLDPGAFERERGVILAEERQRDTPQARADHWLDSLLLAGQLAPLRPPIGDTIVIRNATIDRLRDFYRANYRPDRSTLIVVGDIEPAAVEAEIRQRFNDWTAVGPTAPRRDLGALRPYQAGVDVLKTVSGAGFLQFAWMRPHEEVPDTRRSRRQKTIRDIGLHILARRLDLLAHRPDTPFLRTNVGAVNFLKSADMISISADIAPAAWQSALAAMDQEQRRIVKFGVLQAEVDREIQNERAALQTAAAGDSTRPSTAIADKLAASTDERKVLISPAEDLALFDSMAKKLTAADVDKALRQAFAVKGPRLILQTPEMPFGQEAAIEKAYRASRAVPISAQVSAAIPIWPYTTFGPSGAVSESHSIDDLGIILVRFANGVHLAVKPTKFNDGEVLVRADIGHGRRDFPVVQQMAAWAAAAFIPGGLKAISYDEMWQALSGKEVSIHFSFNDDAFTLQGKTRPGDMATQMQMLAAYASDPAYRPQAFAQLQERYRNDLSDNQLTATNIADRFLPGLLHAGDPRWAAPDHRQISSVTPTDFQAQFAPYLSRGPINVSIVGDVTVDDAIRLTASTFGALPERPATAPAADAPSVHFPAPTKQPVVLNQLQRPDNAAALLAVPVGDLLSDLQRTYATRIAGRIFLERLTAQFRRSEGATYTPRGNTVLSEVFPGYGYAYVYAETTPNEIGRFYEITEKIVDDLRSVDVTSDELARAKQAFVEGVDQERQRNNYWLPQLSGIQTDTRRIDFLRTIRGGYETVTAQDVRAIAQTYFTPEKFWKFEVLPTSANSAVDR